jgi:hypothetical protein
VLNSVFWIWIRIDNAVLDPSPVATKFTKIYILLNSFCVHTKVYLKPVTLFLTLFLRTAKIEIGKRERRNVGKN